MPIERLSMRDGVRIPVDPEVIDQALMRIAAIYVRKFVTLVPGEYDLTPQAWRQNIYSHHLTVHDNDTATYRMFPLSEDAGIMGSDRLAKHFEPGGKVVKIPEDTSTAVVLGGSPDGSIRLFELIQHH